MSDAPHITVLSGALANESRTGRLARWCADECRVRGATASVFGGEDLDLPFYRYGDRHGPTAIRLLDDLARSDGVVLLTPVYHGSVTGLLKNALDYVNELASDERPFLDGRVVGCVAIAGGAQGAAAALPAMRAIVHAMRGWPTPLGVAVGAPGADDERVTAHLGTMLDQVTSAAGLHRGLRPRVPGPRADLVSAVPTARPA
ncbi:MAG TPA: NAD(P)H-dependent oxidoreductase [Thermobifida alba]|nr:NAD(P)H-dependent oxidoreductase [Thermobifida alba]